MASHYQHGDVVPFPLRDYPEGQRFVRPIEPAHIARATRDDCAIYLIPQEQRRIARIVAENKRERRNAIIGLAIMCATAVFLGFCVMVQL